MEKLRHGPMTANNLSPNHWEKNVKINKKKIKKILVPPFRRIFVRTNLLYSPTPWIISRLGLSVQSSSITSIYTYMRQKSTSQNLPCALTLAALTSFSTWYLSLWSIDRNLSNTVRVSMRRSIPLEVLSSNKDLSYKRKQGRIHDSISRVRVSRGSNSNLLSFKLLTPENRSDYRRTARHRQSRVHATKMSFVCARLSHMRATSQNWEEVIPPAFIFCLHHIYEIAVVAQHQNILDVQIA